MQTCPSSRHREVTLRTGASAFSPLGVEVASCHKQDFFASSTQLLATPLQWMQVSPGYIETFIKTFINIMAIKGMAARSHNEVLFLMEKIIICQVFRHVKNCAGQRQDQDEKEQRLCLGLWVSGCCFNRDC
ncbi:hypothetical protein GDO81_000455 [Engystomops pustulosus]|uniref:Uncharacterized protein n=1 Tax=Engystomops pustulosus TaxID=76066 RepID=A0AAV7D4G5_ENGPU|nr:hypothetical protein GDO81_000455 [Engystomops pustulosus]